MSTMHSGAEGPKKTINEDSLGFEKKDLAYNVESGSYEMDVDDNDPDWDHPADYDTLAEGAVDDSSEYDASNPFVGDEYADLNELKKADISGAAMQIRDSDFLKISKKDKELSRNEEDLRNDLDEEGYPVFKED